MLENELHRNDLFGKNQASDQPDRDQSDAHHASGGYAESEGDFDYEEYVEEEFDENSYVSTKRNLWWYVALFLLIMFAISAVLPIF